MQSFRGLLLLALCFSLSACAPSSPTGGTGAANPNAGKTTPGDGTAKLADPSTPETVGATPETTGQTPDNSGEKKAGSEEKTGVSGEKQGEVNRELTRSGVKPAESDTLLLYYGQDPDTVNVLTGNDTTSEAFQRWVYESMADRKFDNPDEWEPSLAESWTFDEKTLEFTIQLRRGVKWHPMNLPDGTALPDKELTSRDVKFSFDCILNPNIDAASMRSYYEDPDAKDDSEKYKIKVTVIDDYSLKVKWTKPYFQAEEFTLGIPIIPRHVFSVDNKGEPISFDFASKEFADGFNNHWANRLMCGTGPLIFKEWKKEERVELVRNPQYWGQPFYFSRVIFKNIPNPNTALQELLQRDLDWGAIPEKNQFIQSRDDENVKAGSVKLVEYSYPGFRYVGYNEKRDFFKDKRVRTALSYSIPVQQIIDDVYKGLAERTSGPFLAGSSSYNSKLEPIPFDLEKAKSLLSEAGWEDTDGDGVRDKLINDTKVAATFDLMIFADSPQFLTIAEIFKENGRKIGVNVQISPAKWALMLQKLRKKEFDACILGWALSWKQDLYQIYHSSQAEVPESSNSIGYQSPELDKLIEELRVTFDKKKQIELYHEMHRILYEDQPYTFLFQEKATGALNSRLQNVKFYKIRPIVDVREWSALSPRMD